jgi:predicted RNA-binding Zn-ribbon protein involved in translation (DUF1610 family)
MMEYRYIVKECYGRFYIHDTEWDYMTTTAKGYRTKSVAYKKARRLNEYLPTVDFLHENEAAAMARIATLEESTEQQLEVTQERIKQLEATFRLAQIEAEKRVSSMTCLNCGEILAMPNARTYDLYECSECGHMIRAESYDKITAQLDEAASLKEQLAEANEKIAALEVENKQMLEFLADENITELWTSWCWTRMVKAQANHADENTDKLCVICGLFEALPDSQYCELHLESESECRVAELESKVAELEAALKPFNMLYEMYRDYRSMMAHPMTFNQWLATDVRIDILIFKPFHAGEKESE